MPRFFVDKGAIKDDRIELGAENSQHIVTVLRGRVGDEITVCDGEGTDYNCTLIDVNKKQALAKILEAVENTNEPDLKITLFQGLPKNDKMELVIQKCVEIGVDRIVPVKTDFTVVKLDNKEDKKVARWNKISESAAKQCGRGKIPVVEGIVSFKEAMNSLQSFDAVIIPYEKEKDRGIKEFLSDFKGKSIAVFIGPEGGFSDKEIQLALEKNVSSVTLGKRILRTETAGLVTSVILLYEVEGK